LDRRLSEPQSRSGSGGEEKNSQPLRGLEPPIIQLVSQGYTTELSFFFFFFFFFFLLLLLLVSTAQRRPWPPPQNPAEFLGGFSIIFFFTG
jgi:drug/metabolite transporter (DMT)-like permease